MSVEERFHAAVNVIRGLPKNGSYQPSHELMLRFYGYFKQATRGPCKKTKPAFWDIVNKAKWEAWNKLGHMSTEDAMYAYVAELQKIVETMSYTDNVANFLGSLHELDGVSFRDLDVVAPEVMLRVRSNPNSPLASRDASPLRSRSADGHVLVSMEDSGKVNSDHVLNNITNLIRPGNLTDSPEHSDDEYKDTVESERELSKLQPNVNGNVENKQESTMVSSHRYSARSRRPCSHKTATTCLVGERVGGDGHVANSSDSINETLSATVNALQADLTETNERVKDLQLRIEAMERDKQQWWNSFKNIPPVIIIVLLVWPFIANRFFKAVIHKRKS